jgi:hypothetical protein
MSVTVTTQHNPLAARIVQDTSADKTAQDNTTQAAGTLYMVEIDNTNASGSEVVYFKLVAATSCTPGTTAPTMVFYCPNGAKRSYVFPEGIAFSNGFSHWCVTGAAQSDDTNPTNPPAVRYVTSAS